MAARVQVVTSEAPLVIEGHAFTTGIVPRTSMERVLPNSQVVFGMADGVGCDTTKYQEGGLNCWLQRPLASHNCWG